MINYKISIAAIFCAGILVLAVTFPVIMEAEAKKDKANQNFDNRCIKMFMGLIKSGADLETIVDKLTKAKCLEG